MSLAFFSAAFCRVSIYLNCVFVGVSFLSLMNSVLVWGLEYLIGIVWIETLCHEIPVCSNIGEIFI